jgi:two-component system response regulator AtoC
MRQKLEPLSEATGSLSPEVGGHELLVTGHGSMSTVPLPREGELLIGRADEAQIMLPTNSVSRRHAMLRVHGDEFTLEDLGSSNGTIIRGERAPAHRRVNVAPGESLLIGEFVLVLRSQRSLGPVRSGSEADGVVLRSPAMLNLYKQTEPIARARINVLILGETGVGKDVLAQSIHERSERAGKTFLRLNCAALAEPLLESELFGHERGAFTGATQSKPGLLVAASGGSVFLDEIGELPPRLQPKLLQVLENQEILSVGSVKSKPIDVRFIAATNRDLETEAAQGGFRSDLYYRLAGFTAIVPPLRERREDILSLAEEFARQASSERAPPRIHEAAAARLLEHAWPGNVRELRNVIERAVVLAGGSLILPEHLPLDKMQPLSVEARRSTPPADAGTEGAVGDLTPKELAERQRILDALAASAGNQSKAAEKLGISRSTLLNRLDAYRMGRPRKRPQ